MNPRTGKKRRQTLVGTTGIMRTRHECSARGKRNKGVTEDRDEMLRSAGRYQCWDTCNWVFGIENGYSASSRRILVRRPCGYENTRMGNRDGHHRRSPNHCCPRRHQVAIIRRHFLTLGPGVEERMGRVYAFGASCLVCACKCSRGTLS